METLNWYSNESTRATAIKNITFVEINVMNISTNKSINFIPLMASEQMIFEYFFVNLSFGCHGNQSNSAVWTKFTHLVEDYSRNISVKLLSKHLQ